LDKKVATKLVEQTGFRRARPLRVSTSSVIVALIRNDWYTFGRNPPPNIWRISSSWPYDRMRSASSMTRDSRAGSDKALGKYNIKDWC
jgi:hypothetical protein